MDNIMYFSSLTRGNQLSAPLAGCWSEQLGSIEVAPDLFTTSCARNFADLRFRNSFYSM